MMMLYNIPANEKKEQVINDGECMRDYTFIWTEGINKYLVDNVVIKNRYMIYAGFLMDFTQVSGVIFFYLKYHTYRPLVAFAIFIFLRQNLQNHFLMGRLEGFTWFYPGFPALTVPYHDTNDFYYSGHVGTTTFYMLEFYFNDQKFMFYASLFVLVN
jgi:hypothetical protein